MLWHIRHTSGDANTMVLAINISPPRALARCALVGLVLALIGASWAPPAAQVSQRESTEKPAFSTARILLPEPEMDFGEVIRGETIEATFEIRNVGAQDLKVLRVEPG